MRAWFERIMWKISGWMKGRYGQNGQDKLSNHLYISSLMLFALSLFLPIDILTTFALAALIYAIFRNLSKNIDKRNKELEAYERLLKMPKEFITLQKLRMKHGKTHKFFRCKCGTILRVPRGHGKIEVTCPKCKLHTLHKS